MPTPRPSSPERRRWASPGGWPQPVRRAVGVLVVLLVLLAVSVTTYRTLRPAENLSRATVPLPSPAPALPVAYGELASTPLIVDGRLRVYAEQRRVWADTPVTAIRTMTPHWAYRRWPAEVVGVLAIERPFIFGPRSLIVTKWSDGSVAALDALTGEVAWQVQVEPAPDDTYRGRRTGARTVYEPDSLFTARSAVDGRLVLLVGGRDQVRAYDPYTGVARWSQVFTEHPGCHDVDWTGETTYVVKDTCNAPATLDVYDAGTGLWRYRWRPPGASAGPGREANWFVEPGACDLGRSGCRLIRAAATADVIGAVDAARGRQGIVATIWRLGLDGTITTEPYVESDAPLIIGDALVEQMLNGYVWARSRSTGALLWLSSAPGRLVAADGDAVYLINREYELLVINPQTGGIRSGTQLRLREGDGWQFRYVYVHDGFVAVERLGSANEDDTDERYYYSGVPVLLVGA